MCGIAELAVMSSVWGYMMPAHYLSVRISRVSLPTCIDQGGAFSLPVRALFDSLYLFARCSEGEPVACISLIAFTFSLCRQAADEGNRGSCLRPSAYTFS